MHAVAGTDSARPQSSPRSAILWIIPLPTALRREGSAGGGLELRTFGDEVLEPAEHEGVLHVLRGAALGERPAPVEADPARDRLARAFQELPVRLDGAAQRKRLFD